MEIPQKLGTPSMDPFDDKKIPEPGTHQQMSWRKEFADPFGVTRRVRHYVLVFPPKFLPVEGQVTYVLGGR